MSVLTSWIVYVVNILVTPLLLVGFLRSMKARLQNRRGPSPLQPLWDIAKLFGKGETVSETVTNVFRVAPLVNFAAILAVALMTPWLGVPSPIAGDLILAVYLLALGKFAAGLAALDTGSPFGALGASREASISVQAEPALLISFAALAGRAGSSSFDAMFRPADAGAPMVVTALLVVVALWMAATAELSRMPIDDPTTHLELTMVHEALILENSGKNLALVECAVALKTAVYLGLIGQVMLSVMPPQPPVMAYLLSLLVIAMGAGLLALVESVVVKLRWRRVPNMLSFAIGAGALACLIVAMKG
jgi:formate hydrogenlyase subunit 4